MNDPRYRLSRRLLAGLLFLAFGGSTVRAQGESGNVCVRDYRGGAVCTANDVRIENLAPLVVVEDCASGTIGETEVQFEALVSAAGSPDRYDIGLYLALDGGSARDGDSCYHDYLSPPLTATPTLGDKNMDGVMDIDGGPWLENDGDTCGDIGSNTQVFKPLTTLRFACVDSNMDGSVDVSVCTSWDNNAGTACNAVTEAFPGTNSKCSCGSVELGIAPITASVNVSKTPASQTVQSGQNATFSISVDNGGGDDLTPVSVVDALCDTLTGPTGDGGTVGTLEDGETWVYTCTVNNVTANFTNSVTVTATPPSGPDVSDGDTADVTVISPAITIDKSPATQTVQSGQNASFTITVDNDGDVDLTGVVFSDPQCDTLTGPTGDAGVTGTLETTETWSYSCTVNNVTASFTNTASATATPPAGPDVSDSDTADVTVESPSVTVSKTPASQTVQSGQSASFTITVENDGNVALTGVGLSDPQCTTLTGPTGDGGVAGTLDVGETWTYSCTVTNVTSGFTNTASVTATPPSGPDVSDSDTADVSVISPSVTVDKTPATQTVQSGQNATFTISVANTGDVALTGVALSDPQCTTLTGPTGDGGVAGTLDVGETWTYSCTVSNVTADFTNTASVTASPPSGPDVSDSDTADVAVEAPSITVSKTPATQTVQSGQNATFTLTVDNDGDVDLTGVTLSDPQCDTLTGPTGDGGVSGTLETTETWTYSCTVNGVTADFTNSVSVTASPPTGPDVSDSDSADVTVISPSISVSKDPPTQAVVSGGSAVFTITVDNNGDVALTTVVVTDPQCDTLTGPTGDGGVSGTLETSETWSYSCTVDNVTAGFTNRVDVAGTPPAGPDVTDSDTADVTIDAPSISVTKTPASQVVLSGDDAMFTLTVRNLGNVPLSSVVVDDPLCTSLSGPSGDGPTLGTLELAETWTYDCTVANVTASFTNTVSVTASPPSGPDVSDTDSADVTVPSSTPEITAVKSSQLVGDNDASGSLSPGDDLRYSIVIENPSAVDATLVMLDDTPDTNTALIVGSVTTSQGTVVVGNTAGDTDVLVDIGTLAALSQVTVTFEVRLDDPFPDAVTTVLNQGVVSSQEVPDVPTDDPDTTPQDDPTEDVVITSTIPAIPVFGPVGMWLFGGLLSGAAAWRLRRRRDPMR